MGLCCLFNQKKRYAYQVGKYMSGYEVQRVLVKDCKVCGNRKVKTFYLGAKEYQSFLCHTEEEVIRISRANGIPLLGELTKNKKASDNDERNNDY